MGRLFGARGREFDRRKVIRVRGWEVAFGAVNASPSQEAFGLSVASAGTRGEAFF